jgi:hypothetical protein
VIQTNEFLEDAFNDVTKTDLDNFLDEIGLDAVTSYDFEWESTDGLNMPVPSESPISANSVKTSLASTFLTKLQDDIDELKHETHHAMHEATRMNKSKRARSAGRSIVSADTASTRSSTRVRPGQGVSSKSTASSAESVSHRITRCKKRNKGTN